MPIFMAIVLTVPKAERIIVAYINKAIQVMSDSLLVDLADVLKSKKTGCNRAVKKDTIARYESSDQFDAFEWNNLTFGERYAAAREWELNTL